MSAVERALAILCSPRAVLTPHGAGFGVFSNGDRRRRPAVRVHAGDVRELLASGAISALPAGAGYAITEAGRARMRRTSGAPGEGFIAQHGAIVPRTMMDAEGTERVVRGLAQNHVLRRLASIRDNQGAPWLSGAELAAAARLRSHWESGQVGLVRGSDWNAPPNSRSARGLSSAQEAALAARCDARRKTEDVLAALAAPLRRVVERVCLREDGLEALERSEGWPARSGKLALKLGLAQLAASF